jgi:hypothetical protein
MELSPIEKYVKNKKEAIATGIKKHTAFLHNRTFWTIYFAGFLITFPLTIALLGVCIGFLGAGIGLLTGVFVLWLVMYAVAFGLPLVSIWGLFSFVFDFPDTFAVGMTSTAVCLAAMGLGCFAIVGALALQKQINKLFRRGKKGGNK